MRSKTAIAKQAKADAKLALQEDVGTGDLSAKLVPNQPATAKLYYKDANPDAVLCGQSWFENCFREIGRAKFTWHKKEGSTLSTPNAVVCEIKSDVHTLLTAERSAINFLQTLSATATAARRWQKLSAGKVTIVDTRKTIPLLRVAQKYATKIGGISNHRWGLYDEILIKENHLALAGGVAQCLIRAKNKIAATKIQIEVQNLTELQQAIAAGATRVLLDNFTLNNIRRAVAIAAGRVELEVSGNVRPQNVKHIAASGIDRISVGAITKNIQVIDFSLIITSRCR